MDGCLDSLLAELEETTSKLRSSNSSNRLSPIYATLTRRDDSLEEIKEPIYANQSSESDISSTSKNHSYNLDELDELFEGLSHSRRKPENTGKVNELRSALENEIKRSNENPTSRSKTFVSPVTYTHKEGPSNVSTTERDQNSASKATQELENLMASLRDFKVKETSPKYGKISSPSANETPLDSILGTLQSDLSKHGVNTTAKGHCCYCQKPIVGEVVTAIGKTWHPEHFTCITCGSELADKSFFERDNEPYCEVDYHNLFSPKCAYCNAAIIDKVVTALDQTWHPEHFFCTRCGKRFGDEGYHEKDGKPYCSEDYFILFAPKCAACNCAIKDNYVSALNVQWHPDCFVCRACRTPFAGGSFYDHEGQPYCETHYHEKRGSLCAGCHKPITGRCITAISKKFHPDHFVCSFCLGKLTKGSFKEMKDKLYCQVCHDKLFLN